MPDSLTSKEQLTAAAMERLKKSAEFAARGFGNENAAPIMLGEAALMWSEFKRQERLLAQLREEIAEMDAENQRLLEEIRAAHEPSAALPDPEKYLYSDAMDAAASAFHSTRHGILKNAERVGETTDGEKLIRRSIAAAFNAYLLELRPAVPPKESEAEDLLRSVMETLDIGKECQTVAGMRSHIISALIDIGKHVHAVTKEACLTCGADLPPLAQWSMPHCPKCALAGETSAALKVGDRARVTLSVHSAIPADGWTVIGLPGQYRKTYHLEHDKGGNMTIDAEYVCRAESENEQ